MVVVFSQQYYKKNNIRNSILCIQILITFANPMPSAASCTAHLIRTIQELVVYCYTLVLRLELLPLVAAVMVLELT